LERPVTYQLSVGQGPAQRWLKLADDNYPTGNQQLASLATELLASGLGVLPTFFFASTLAGSKVQPASA
jgi:hypothetical protein